MSILAHRVSYVFYCFILFIAVILSGCEDKVDKIDPMPRPVGVPHDAMWIGGLDGGIYLSIHKNEADPPLIYDAVIYYSVGEIDYKGKLKISSLEQRFDYKEVSLYSAWDGDTLYLRDGRQLVIPTE